MDKSKVARFSGSLYTMCGCAGIFIDISICVANILQNVTVKEFWKSIENWQSYRYSLVYYE